MSTAGRVMSAADRPVWACLREADHLVGDLTFQVGSLPTDQLLAAWSEFLGASSQVLTSLRPAGQPAAHELRRQVARWPRQGAGTAQPDPALAAATNLLVRAGQLLARTGPETAPNRPAVLAGHVLRTVGVGAHVVAAALRDQPHPAAPTPGPTRTPRHDTAPKTDTGPVPGPVVGPCGQEAYAQLIARLAEAEDYALTAIRHAEPHPWPPLGPPPDPDPLCLGGTP